MIFLNEHKTKINALYKELEDLKEGKRILEKAMNNNFYNRTIYDRLFIKLNKVNDKIKATKEELEKEKKEDEKSRQSI